MNKTDNKENIDTKTRQYDNFDKSVWKIDDKAWMKERRAGWSSVKNTLDLMFEHNRNIFRDKKPYKYIKQFYLTGSIDFPEEIGGISYISEILDMNSPLDMWYAGGDIGGLIECWLTPELPKEKWEQVFERYEQVWIKRKEPENVGKIFEECRICYRNSLVNWYTELDQISLFNGLEAELTAFFQPFPDASYYDFYWGVMRGIFFRTCGFMGEVVYNPNHPVYEQSQQIVNALIPCFLHKVELIKEQNNSERTIKYYSGKNNEEFTRHFSFLCYISNHPEAFGSKQVKLAMDILTGIEQLNLPEDLKKLFEDRKNKTTNRK